MKIISRFFCSKTIRKALLLIVLCVLGITAIVYLLRDITVNPLQERRGMYLLEETKRQFSLQPFASDGCSGNISRLWKSVVTNSSEISPRFAKHYGKSEDVPFVDACIAHDRLYHTGEGGYSGRLRADNRFRQDILEYAMTNSEEIKARTGLRTEEAVIFLYETIAEVVYRGVRLGGAPCTGMPYAWGYGYNNGSCNASQSQ